MEAPYDITRSKNTTNGEMKNMYLSFHVGDEVYGIEIRHVIQIIGMQRITPMPEMLPDMLGYICLRGKTIPIVSMRMRLGKGTDVYSTRTCIVVVQVGDKEIGLIVDAIRETVPIDPGNISPPPITGKSTGTVYVIGVARLAGGSIALLIHVNRLFARHEF